MNRRSFLHTAPALIGAAAGLSLIGCRDTDEMQPAAEAGTTEAALLTGPVGVQLYTLRSLMQDDFDGVLQRVAELGYEELEFAGYYDRDPQALREQLDGLGLTAPSTHIPLQVIENDFVSAIETAQTLGHEYIICPYLDDQQRQGGVARYQELAAVFNEAGRQCRDAGIQFGYHNHAFEFETADGQVLYDVLLEETDPELVAMELDLYWINAAGYDPLDYFERYPGRFHLFHVKDRTADGTMAAVGQGSIDFASIFARAEQAGVRHYFVEHDNPSDPLASIEASIAHLRG